MIRQSEISTRSAFVFLTKIRHVYRVLITTKSSRKIGSAPFHDTLLTKPGIVVNLPIVEKEGGIKDEKKINVDHDTVVCTGV